jgi:hypothetical protein
MTNGGTGPYKGKIIFMNQGRGSLPANMALVDPKDPSNTVRVPAFAITSSLTCLSIDRDIGQLLWTPVHLLKRCQSPSIWRDILHRCSLWILSMYAPSLLSRASPSPSLIPNPPAFKPEPQIAIQVYRFNPQTGAVRIATDLINKPNGLTFSHDYKSAYMYVCAYFLNVELMVNECTVRIQGYTAFRRMLRCLRLCTFYLSHNHFRRLTSTAADINTTWKKALWHSATDGRSHTLTLVLPMVREAHSSPCVFIVLTVACRRSRSR